MDDDLPYCIETDFQASMPDVDETETEIRRVVVAVLSAEGCPDAEISVAVVDDSAIHSLNRRYLGHDRATDVLAFDLSDDDGPGAGDSPAVGVQGQIVVNAEMATREATERGIAVMAELMLYVAHGCLHLLGYNDLEDPQASRMHCREDELLSQLGYGRTYSGLDD